MSRETVFPPERLTRLAAPTYTAHGPLRNADSAERNAPGDAIRHWPPTSLSPPRGAACSGCDDVPSRRVPRAPCPAARLARCTGRFVPLLRPALTQPRAPRSREIRRVKFIKSCGHFPSKRK